MCVKRTQPNSVLMGPALTKRVADILFQIPEAGLTGIQLGLAASRLSLQHDPSGCPLAQPSTSHGVGLWEPQTCTTGRHLGSEEGGASVQLLQDSWPSGGA